MYYFYVFYFMGNGEMRRGKERQKGKELEQKICLLRVYNLGVRAARHNQME